MMGLALPRQQVEGLVSVPLEARGACIIQGIGAQHEGEPKRPGPVLALYFNVH